MTIDEIFASMPEEDAATGRDYLVIDPAARSITVPESEKIFGVEGDENAARKYFICPRYVGDNLDLAGMFLTVYWRNANGDEDGCMVQDVQAKGEYITFSWLLSEKAVAYKGPVQFAVCADLPNTASKRRPDWNTTLAEGEVLEGMDPDLGDLETGSSDVLTQLREMVTAQTAAVEATGAAQVAEVKTQGTNTTQEAVAAIQAQGAATVASIPADYTALAATVDRLTRDRAAAIVCAAEGTAIQVPDASNDPLQGLRIFGRSTQDGTPTPDAPVEIVSTPAPVVQVCGVNLWNHENDTVDMANLSGWGSAIWRNDAVVKTLRPNTTYTMRFSVTCLAVPEYESMFSDDCGFVLYSAQETGKFITLAMSKGAGAFSVGEKRTAECTFTTPENVQDVSMGYEILRYVQRYKQADGSAVYATAKFEDVQLELGDVATEYEPYNGSTLTITTPGSLPGIPVSSGGNYTDDNGQQWIADEVDLARGVYVQRVAVETCDGSTDEKWWVYSGTNREGYARDSAFMRPGAMQSGFCNRFPVHSKITSEPGVWLGQGNNYMYVHNATDIAPDLNAWLAWLQANPVTVAYLLATPVETPLTDAELQAFLAMHSNKPTTTVLNDAGAHMALEYAADPKTFICNQIAAAIAAK